MVEYYQGETIRFNIKAGGTNAIDLTETDFVVAISNVFGTYMKVFKKSDLTAIEFYYQGRIESVSTKLMPIGVYVMEIMLKDTDTVILHTQAFNLKNSIVKTAIDG